MADRKSIADSAAPSAEPRKVMKEISAVLRDRPGFGAAVALESLYSNEKIHEGWEPGIDIAKMQALLDEQMTAVSSGNLSRLEKILTVQAHVLQNVFTSYIGKASRADFIDHLKCYSGIAMKAQAQCRQTIALVGELKNPRRTTFIQNQNNAVNQQINHQKNARKSADSDPQLDLLENIPSASNELLESQNERVE